MSLLSSLMTQSVTVETFAGTGPRGPVYAAPVTVTGFLDDGLVRAKESGGIEVIAKSTLFTDIANASLLTDNSRVTANGVVHTVSAARRREGGPLLAGVAHLEVDLT